MQKSLEEHILKNHLRINPTCDVCGQCVSLQSIKFIIYFASAFYGYCFKAPTRTKMEDDRRHQVVVKTEKDGFELGLIVFLVVSES